MLYIGLDWSKNEHHVCILNEAGARISQLQIPHSLEGFQRLDAERARLNVPAQECHVAIETNHNLVVDYLLDRDYVLYIIPPSATGGYRNRQRSSGAYDDNSDAALLASIVHTPADRESHRRLQLNKALTQEILGQVRLIEALRRSIQRQGNQLRAALVRSYPLALTLFSGLTLPITLQFLQAHPSAEEARSLSREALDAFCRAHGDHRRDLSAQRYAHLRESMPPAHPDTVRACREQIRVLAQVLLPQVRCRQEAVNRLAHLFSQHPDAFIFDSLPGAGKLLAPALLAKFGDHRERFAKANEVQALAGTCPLTKRSGKRRMVMFRRGCDKEFRRIAQQFALASRKQSTWSTAYWHEIRPHCASNSHATRILANRWLAIIWKLWQTRQPYDEAYHLQQRAKRRMPR